MSENTKLALMEGLSEKKVMPTEDEVKGMNALISILGPNVGTPVVPSHIKTEGQMAAVLLKAWELDVPPMQALSLLYIINGRVSCQTELMLGIANRSNLAKCEVLKQDINGCRVRIERLDKGTVFEYEFTQAMAKTANLWGKQGPWAQYPEVMMYNRAMTLCLRQACPDIIGGLRHADEEGIGPDGPRVLSLEVDGALPESTGVVTNADGVIVDADFETPGAAGTAEPLAAPLMPAEKMAEAEEFVIAAMPVMAEADAVTDIETIATSRNVNDALKAMGLPGDAQSIKAVKTLVGMTLWPEGPPSPWTNADHQRMFGYVEQAREHGGLPELLFRALCQAEGVGVDEVVVPASIMAAAEGEPDEDEAVRTFGI